ncbi:hypothetical protein Hsero_2350 [Herbaspirillum seropedicae SmR1]|uniref:Uncharacterized protein n=1 Tax=Herbaspirillum seropedicae (strain SmR1) TaxID=757424 RepID=D8IVB0_HERSS|nr:hypothetical protein Hsero_2350 [Herbaspirillum seropedicae SmR1]
MFSGISNSINNAVNLEIPSALVAPIPKSHLLLTAGKQRRTSAQRRKRCGRQSYHFLRSIWADVVGRDDSGRSMNMDVGNHAKSGSAKKEGVS